MNHPRWTRRGLALALFAALAAPAGFAQNSSAQNGIEHWVTTWTTAHLPPPAVRLGPVGQPIPTPQQALSGFTNQTIRMTVPISVTGRRVRVHLSNAYGSAPLVVGAVHLGIHAKESAIVPGSDRALTFGGKPGFTIPPGASALTDSIDFDAPPLAELAVSVYVPGTTGAPTIHSNGLHTTYVSKTGDATAQLAIDDAATTQSWYWVSAVDVLAPAGTSAIVAFGDSITDGARSTVDTNSAWPSRFSRRLLANPATANFAVANQGIGGNRILRDGTGMSALARFDGDVLSQAGVAWLIVLEGINDIGRGNGPNANPGDAATAEELIAGLRQMIERAHVHGIRVAGATLTPYTGAPYFSDKGEGIRETINTWIRSSGAFDAVIDFDAATRDPEHPKQFRPAFDSGDHLHPNDAGYQAMADSIDLTMFGAPASTTAARR
jgi:lysophospholipase L1-like esterase